MARDEMCSGGNSGYPSDCELTQALRDRARKRQESADKGALRAIAQTWA